MRGIHPQARKVTLETAMALGSVIGIAVAEAVAQHLDGSAAVLHCTGAANMVTLVR